MATTNTTATTDITTTLNKILSFDPCERGWETLLNSLGKTQADDEPISYLHILESNGIKDTIWCMRCEWFEHRAVWVQFVVGCKESATRAATVDISARIAAAQATATATAAAAAAHAADAAAMYAAHAHATAMYATYAAAAHATANATYAAAAQAAERLRQTTHLKELLTSHRSN